MNTIPRRWLHRFTGEAGLRWHGDERLRDLFTDNRPLPPEPTEDWAEGPLLTLERSDKGRLSLGGLTLGGRGELTGCVEVVRAGAGRWGQAAGAEGSVPDGYLGGVLVLRGAWRGEATAPSGPATVRGTANAEAELAVARLLPADTGWRDFLQALFQAAVPPDALADGSAQPTPDTWQAIRRHGALRLTTTASARLMAGPTGGLPTGRAGALSAGVTVRGRAEVGWSGRWAVEIGPDRTGDGRVRLRLRTGSGGDQAATLAVRARLNWKPHRALASFDSVLGRLLGLDPGAALEWLAVLAARHPAELPAEPAPLARVVLADILVPLTTGQLLGGCPTTAQARLHEAVGALLALEDRVRELVVRRFHRLDRLTGPLRELAATGEAAALSAASVALLAQAGIPAAELLADAKAFEAVRSGLDRLLSGATLPDLAAVLTHLLGTLRAQRVLGVLAACRTPDDLRLAAGQEAGRLAELLLGERLDEVAPDRQRRLLALAADLHHRIDKCRRAFERGLRELVEPRWRAELALDAARLTRETRLAEADVDLSTDAGRHALRQALRGDPMPLLEPATPTAVRPVRALTDESLRQRTSVQLQVGPLGWTAVETVAVRGELEVRPQGEMFAHRLKLTASAKSGRTSPGGVSREGEIRLTALARALQPRRVADPSFSDWDFRAAYTLAERQRIRRAEELGALLDLAQTIGLTGGRTADELAADLLDRPGSAVRDLTYRVRVEPTVFRRVLALDGIARAVEDSVIEVARWGYLRHGGPTSWLRRLGGGLTLEENRRLFQRLGRLDTSPCLALLGPAQGLKRERLIPLEAMERRKLEVVFTIAREAGRLFEALATHHRRGAVPGTAVTAFGRGLAELHNRLARWGTRLDTLPHTLLRLAGRAGGTGEGVSATLELLLVEEDQEPRVVTLVTPTTPRPR